MNTFKHILLIIILCNFSCSEDKFDEINKNQNSPTDVPISLLLPHVIVNTISGVAGDGAGEYASFFVEHATNVHINQRRPNNVNSTVWSRIYSNLNDLKTIVEKGSAGGNEDGQYFAVGIAKILYSYTLSIGTDLFGAMPHTEALDGSLNRTPIFDSQQEIYTFIQQYLDEAIDDLNKPSLSNYSNEDLIFNGNSEMWKKTAYSLKARLYNRLSNIDAQSSAQNALSALQAGFSNESESFTFDGYLPGNTNDNPWTGWQKQEQTYAVSRTFIDLVAEFSEGGSEDPRAELWFTRINGEFVGAPSGEAESDLTHTTYSAPSTETVLYDEAPQPLITYDELKFIEAEAQLRLNNRSAANAAYEEAVIAALKRVGINNGAIDDYTSQTVVFPGENGLTLEHIIKQKNISFWMFQSLEAYNDQRRTGIPGMNDPGGTPLRLPYPPSEVNRNANTPSEINDVTIYEISVWWAQP